MRTLLKEARRFFLPTRGNVTGNKADMRWFCFRTDESSERLASLNGSCSWAEGSRRLTKITEALGRAAEPMKGTSLMSTPDTNVRTAPLSGTDEVTSPSAIVLSAVNG